IQTNPAKAATPCRILAKKGSVRFLRPLNSIQNSRLPQGPMPERRREPHNPGCLLHQPRNVRCTTNGSSYLPSRAASGHGISHRESLSAGRTCSKSSEIAVLHTVDNDEGRPSSENL